MTRKQRMARSEAQWDRIEAEHYGASEAADVARTRRVMLGCTLRMMAERQAVADDLADLLASVLVEMESLAELAEIVACATARAEDRR